MKRLIIYYNFIVVTLMTLVGFIEAETIPHLISALLFFPLAVYFGQQVLPKRKKALVLPDISPIKPSKDSQKAQKNKVTKHDEAALEGTLSPIPSDTKSSKPVVLKKHFDADRRTFVKLIGSAGLTVFFFSLFTKKTHAAFFGSVPGPGTVAVKDSTGAAIDPAIKTPTDGYRITEVDDSSPSYYGFVDKTGKWFIMKENSAGAYRYVKGDSGFSTSWTNRADLTYDYFDNIF